VIYRFFASANSGSDYEAAIELARKAELEAVLQNKRLGGDPSWTIEDFINADVWVVCGEQAGVRAASLSLERV
jgi:hypothetical protein